MRNKLTDFVPYLYFEGNCEEALNFYSKVFDGQVNIQERYNNPAMQAPKEYHDKVLHASLEFEGYRILAADVFPDDKSTKKGNWHVALSITTQNAETGKNIFEQLAKGGQVMQPFQKQFWGAWHGSLTDRYGISWMVNCIQTAG